MSDQNESSYEALLDRIQNRRWPKKGDRLLKESHDWERSVKISPDIPQMTSKFAEIVPRPHLQGHSVPIAAIR